jgi:hypothetical protein
LHIAGALEVVSGRPGPRPFPEPEALVVRLSAFLVRRILDRQSTPLRAGAQ